MLLRRRLEPLLLRARKLAVALDAALTRDRLAPPNRGVEQLAARRAHNPEVAGSNPVPATNLRATQIALGGLGSLFF